MKYTRAQEEGLALLETEPRETTKASHHNYIGGIVAAALVRRGLAREVRDGGHVRRVAITDAGRRALADLRRSKERTST